jgi:hypothetical protein
MYSAPVIVLENVGAPIHSDDNSQIGREAIIFDKPRISLRIECGVRSIETCSCIQNHCHNSRHFEREFIERAPCLASRLSTIYLNNLLAQSLSEHLLRRVGVSYTNHHLDWLYKEEYDPNNPSTLTLRTMHRTLALAALVSGVL